MKFLKISASMVSPLSCYDDYSPALDSLLAWLWLDERGLVEPNPQSTESLLDIPLPLEKADVMGEWYWKTSSPCYTVQTQQTTRMRKRWDVGEMGYCNWGKRKAKINTSEGGEKNYDLPLYLRSTSKITWYVVGDACEIKHLLDGCKAIGKKRSQGWGQVINWDVQETDRDWHLWRDGNLMRPMPVRLMPDDYPIQNLLRWGWRPPAWLHGNQELCHMPINNVRKLEATG